MSVETGGGVVEFSMEILIRERLVKGSIIKKRREMR